VMIHGDDLALIAQGGTLGGIDRRQAMGKRPCQPSSVIASWRCAETLQRKPLNQLASGVVRLTLSNTALSRQMLPS
jgi:hypothetical protein